MKKLIDSLIEKTGEQMALLYPDGKELSVSALLLPLFSRAEDPAEAVCPLGEVSRLRWRYIGPSAGELKNWKGVILQVGDENYDFVWAKDYGLNSQTSHWEGLVKRREDTHGQIG